MPISTISLRRIALGAVATLLSAGALFAGDITINDAYARSSGKSGAVFMEIVNTGDTDDRLIAASTTVARVAELHTHIEDENGVMKMREVEGGFAVPAGAMHMLARGGDHVMLMGLAEGLPHDSTIELTLTFEKSGDMTLTVPVDLKRKPKMHGHGTMDN